MPQAAIAFGVVLSLVGVAFYAATGAISPTALIPALVGILMILAGGLARREGLRAHAMHVAALVGTLGFLGCLPGLVKLPVLLGDGVVARPLAVVEQSITVVLCLVFVTLCVRSFVKARRARRA
jgi:hypothetical protein